MKYVFLLLLTLFLCLDLSAQALDALPTIDQPQEFDKIHTYTRGFSAAFRLDTLRKYFSADIVEGVAVNPNVSIPDSLRGRYFISTLDSLYYVDYLGAFVNLTPGTGGGGGTTWNDLTGIPDSVVYSAELAAAQAAAEAYADANDANTQNPFQTISKAGSTVTLSDGGGSFTDNTVDGDSNPFNELQTISKSGSTVTLSNSGGSFTDDNTQLNETQVDNFVANNGYLTAEVDGSVTNELQTVSKVGSIVTLSNGGGTFSVIDPDGSPTNESQTLSAGGTTSPTINLTSAGGAGGGAITYSGSGGTTLSRSGNTITISSSAGGGDNLGNHTATTDLAMGGNEITFLSNKTRISGASGTARFGDFGNATTVYNTHIDFSTQAGIPISGNNILFAREVLADGVYTDNLYKTRLWVRSNRDNPVPTTLDSDKQLLTLEDVPLTSIKTKAFEQVKTFGSTTDFAATLPQGTYEVTYHFRYKTNTAGGGILWFVNTNAQIDASEGGFARTDQFSTETAWTTGSSAATPFTVTNTYAAITYKGVMEIDAATTVTVSTGPNGTGNLTLGANSYVKYVRIKKP